jgi:hypothetical protein
MRGLPLPSAAAAIAFFVAAAFFSSSSLLDIFSRATSSSYSTRL